MKDYTAVAERIKNLNDPWLNNIDPAQLSGFGPTYSPTTLDDDNFHVPLAGDRHARKSVALDAELIAELATKENLTPDEKQLIEQYSNNSFQFHYGDWLVQAQYERGAWHISAVDEENGAHKTFKLGGLDRFAKDEVTSRCLKYLKPAPLWKTLSESDLLQIARMSPNSPESAIYTYISWAVPGVDEDISADPKYQGLCNSILWFVAENHFPEFDQSAYQFMSEKLGNRPLTWAMVKELFAMWKEHKFDAARRPSLLFNPPPEPEPTQESITEQINNLTDEQVARLRLDVLQMHHRR